MTSYVWRSGEPAERSVIKVSPNDLALQESGHFNNNAMEITDMDQDSNRRDTMNGKLNDRYLVHQTSKNPFLAGADYMNDLTIQDQYLRPKSSHIENPN
jgi:methionine-rich copper-binding protein CopC